MLVSVIIPTYNRASFLGRAISSVLAQSYEELELIIVDDGSSDNSKVICDEIQDERISYYFKDNGGVSSARNFGVERANGKFIAFLDSDDEWHTDKISKQLQRLKSSQRRIIHSGERWIRDGEIVKQKKSHQKFGGDMFIRSLTNCVISPSSVVMEKSLYLEMEGMREDFVVCEDYDLWLKITSLYDIEFIDEELMTKYAGHDDQLSFKFFAMDYWRVKSMYWILQNRSLDREREEVLRNLCLKKCHYLLKGYEKYDNYKNYDEVKEVANYMSK